VERRRTPRLVPIATFDPKAIDVFRLMGNKSKVHMHYHPLAVLSYDLCLPPDLVVAGVDRNIRLVPIGISVTDEPEKEGGVETRHLFTELAQSRTSKGTKNECS